MAVAYKQQRSRTGQIIAEMLTENTGAAIMDSGGTPKYDENGNYIGSQYGYGRNYERNKGRNFEAEQATVLDFRYREISVTHNLYHWLLERLDYDGIMDYRFRRFAERPENEHEHWLVNMEAFPAYLKSKGHDIGGPYWNPDELHTDNSYNSENFLSQDIQYLVFEVDGQSYTLLQVHGGADARGGYTRPRAFRLFDSDSLLFYSDAAIHCEGRQVAPEEQLDLPEMGKRPSSWELMHSWTYSGGWSNQGNYWGGYPVPGSDIPIDEYEIKRAGIDDDDEEELAPGQGYIYVDDDGVGYCPIDGSPLSASC